MGKPKPERRWYQFSLRALLVFVLLVSVGMSWLGVKLQQARKQKAAVEAIEKAGGVVYYDYGRESRSLLPTEVEPPYPTWLRESLGDDFFFDVRAVSANDVSDEHLNHLAKLTTVKSLYLDSPQITDAGLEHLAELGKVCYLSLPGTQITDAGLVHLKSLTNLTTLDLSGTQITDAGLVHLTELTSLGALGLSDTQITDGGLEHVRLLTNLEWLFLHGTQITDAGLIHLKSLTTLRVVALSDTKVTDEGVEDLKGALPRLEMYCPTATTKQPTP